MWHLPFSWRPPGMVIPPSLDSLFQIGIGIPSHLGRRGYTALIYAFFPRLLYFSAELPSYSKTSVLWDHLGRWFGFYEATCCKLLPVIAGYKVNTWLYLKDSQMFHSMHTEYIKLKQCPSKYIFQSPYWIFLSFSIFICSALRNNSSSK